MSHPVYGMPPEAVLVMPRDLLMHALALQPYTWPRNCLPAFCVASLHPAARGPYRRDMHISDPAFWKPAAARAHRSDHVKIKGRCH